MYRTYGQYFLLHLCWFVSVVAAGTFNCSTDLTIPWSSPSSLTSCSTSPIVYRVALNSADSKSNITAALISPSTATCLQGVCTAPVTSIASFNVYIGDGCVPSSTDNAYSDLTPQFAKQFSVCTNCASSAYYIVLERQVSSMPCSYKILLPRIQTTSGSSCSFQLISDTSILSSCKSGIVRPYITTCSYTNTITAAQDYGYQGLSFVAVQAFPLLVTVAVLVGAVLSPTLIWAIKKTFFSDEHKTIPEPIHLEEDAKAADGPVRSTAALGNVANSNNTNGPVNLVNRPVDEEDVPAELPPHFFVAWN